MCSKAAFDALLDIGAHAQGAVARSAYFLGAAGLLCSAKNSAPLSSAASKASAGALELMDVLSSKQLPKLLAAARDVHGWDVIAATGSSIDAVPSRCLERAPNSVGTIVVLGSEGRGLRTNTRRACSRSVYIEGGSGSPLVDSLNLSVASGILLHRLLAEQDR